jgi:hypothetical protein
MTILLIKAVHRLKKLNKKSLYSCETKGTGDVQGVQEVYNYDAISPYFMVKGGLTKF